MMLQPENQTIIIAQVLLRYWLMIPVVQTFESLGILFLFQVNVVYN